MWLYCNDFLNINLVRAGNTCGYLNPRGIRGTKRDGYFGTMNSGHLHLTENFKLSTQARLILKKPFFTEKQTNKHTQKHT